MRRAQFTGVFGGVLLRVLFVTFHLMEARQREKNQLISSLPLSRRPMSPTI